MTGLRRILAGFAGATLLAAGAASATQDAAPSAPTVSDLTVRAAPRPSPLVNSESQFVRSHLPDSNVTGQYPRFRDPVCVKVQGLPSEFSAFVAKRIIAVATQVHAPVAKAGDCKPNVDVVFTTEPKALLSDIARRKDILVGFYDSHAELAKLAAFNRPIEARYVTRNRDQFGQSRLEIHNPVSYLDPPVGRAGSRLSNGMSTEVVHSLILADANRVAGEKIDAVADYIAVLALAKWQGLERCNAIPTILNLMADNCGEDAPEAVTPTDIALLTGLYAVEARELGSQQRAAIAERMTAPRK